MSRKLYLECYSGISGDMTVAALSGLMKDRTPLFCVLDHMPVEGFSYELKQVKKSGIDAWDFLVKLDAEKPVIVCGDMNVAHEEIDLKNPKTNRKNAGFTDEERGKMTELLAAGFTDTFRHFNPTLEGVYSWWSYRFHAREKNAGWRIDYFLVSNRFVERVKDARILTDVFGSDHCPVLIEIE